MNLELDGKSVFVAAASKGLGRGVATRFAAEGALVTIASRSEANLKDAREAIVAETGCDEGAVTTVPADLTDRDAVDRGIRTAIDAYGKLNVLVTNHGGPPNAPFGETSLDEFDRGYDDVLRSTVAQCKAALPALRESGGAVTHLIAASAREPTPNGTIGNVFRPGIYGLSKVLANEEGRHGVRSNCVVPRGVRTDRIESKIAARAEREGITEARVRELRVEELPVDELGTPEDFGKAVAFVSSPAARYTTGSVIAVDGGWSRRVM